jgi:hypothetical protein
MQNFPREYSRNCLSKYHGNIYLLETTSGKIFKSPILTSSKNLEDRFVYLAWKRFVKENKLHFRDRLIFNAPYGDNKLEVQIMRFNPSS